MKKRPFADWLRDYKKYNKDGYVPAKFRTPEGYYLGYWLRHVVHGMYRLTASQMNKLEQAGFNPNEICCSRTFEEWLNDFKKYNVNGKVKKYFITPEGYCLGSWYYDIKAGRRRINSEQRLTLIKAGFIFDVRKFNSFIDYYNAFVKYNEDGNIKNQFVTPEGLALGAWVYRVKSGAIKLSKDEKKMLNEANFNWDLKKRRSFEDWVLDFKKYQKDGFIPAKFITPEGYKLGRWVQNIKQGNIRLDVKKTKMLMDAGFSFNKIK